MFKVLMIINKGLLIIVNGLCMYVERSSLVPLFLFYFIFYFLKTKTVEF